MSTAPVSPFLLVGDPSAGACEGDFCPVPEPGEQVAVAQEQEQAPSPAAEDAQR